MLPLLMGLGGPEILFLVLIVVLLFGAKKIPELMKGVGKGVKSFKDGINGIGEADAPKEAVKQTVVKTEEQ